MPLWDDLKQEVYDHTKRPDRVAETEFALKNAIRTAHKSGKYWRDLTTASVAPTVEVVQQIDLTNNCPRFRQLAYLKSGTLDKYYEPVTINDLLDSDNYVKLDICWGHGDKLMVRSSTPEESYTVGYYQYPDLSNPSVTLSSWILDHHRELVTIWAAVKVLSILGEQEMKQSLEKLAAIAFADLQQDNLEIHGR